MNLSNPNKEISPTGFKGHSYYRPNLYVILAKIPGMPKKAIQFVKDKVSFNLSTVQNNINFLLPTKGLIPFNI